MFRQPKKYNVSENINSVKFRVCVNVFYSFPVVLSYLCIPVEESQGEIEVKDPCACESLVEFQQATMNSLEQLTQKHILKKRYLQVFQTFWLVTPCIVIMSTCDGSSPVAFLSVMTSSTEEWFLLYNLICLKSPETPKILIFHKKREKRQIKSFFIYISQYHKSNIRQWTKNIFSIFLSHSDRPRLLFDLIVTCEDVCGTTGIGTSPNLGDFSINSKLHVVIVSNGDIF